jgi:hypothetical protein
LGVLLGRGVFVGVGEAVTGAPTVTTDGVEMVAVVVGPAVLAIVATAVVEIGETRAVFDGEIPEHPAISEATVSRQAR